MRLVPLPKIDKCKKVLFIGPHPDDIEIGAGGLVSKLVRNQAEVYFLICCDGGCGSMDKDAKIEDIVSMRKKEANDVASFLGAKKVFFLDYPDGGKYSVDDLQVDIAKVVIDIKPDLVVSPSPNLRNETHMDHLRVAEAARRSLLIASYPLVAKRQGIANYQELEFISGVNLAYYFEARTNQVVRLKKKDVENKINAFKKHASQLNSSGDDVIKYIKYKAKILGIKHFAGFGESYFVMGTVHQHCFCEKM